MREARSDVEKAQSLIDKGEARKKQIELLLADEELYRDADKCRALMSEYQQIRKELAAQLEVWERAALRLEELEKQKDEELRGYLAGGSDLTLK